MNIFEKDVLKDPLLVELEFILENRRLPPKYDTDPGMFVRLVYRTWPRDGRGGHFGLGSIAEVLSEKTGQTITRNKLNVMFLGQRHGVRRAYQRIPQEIAQEFVRLALTHWKHNTITGYEPYQNVTAADLTVILDAVQSAFIRFAQVKQVAMETPGKTAFKDEDIATLLERVLESGVRPVFLADLEYLLRVFETDGPLRALSPELVKQLLLFRRAQEV